MSGQPVNNVGLLGNISCNAVDSAVMAGKSNAGERLKWPVQMSVVSSALIKAYTTCRLVSSAAEHVTLDLLVSQSF